MQNRKLKTELRLINMENVAVEEVEWLLYPLIPYGKVTIIQGDPGEGKTTMVLQIIAKLTKGEPVLPVKDGETETAEQAGKPVNVIYQLVEELKIMQTNIREVAEQLEQAEITLSEEGLQDMKNDCLDMLKAIIWLLDGASYLWQEKEKSPDSGNC